MAITSELLGKLGGGIDWKVKTIEGSWRGHEDRHFIYRVEVPAGEQKLVVMTGLMTAVSSNSAYNPTIHFGPYSIPYATKEGDNIFSMAGVFSESADIIIQTFGSSYLSPISFSGGINMIDYDTDNIERID